MFFLVIVGGGTVVSVLVLMVLLRIGKFLIDAYKYHLLLLYRPIHAHFQIFLRNFLMKHHF